MFFRGSWLTPGQGQCAERALKDAKSAVIGHPKRNSTPKKTASTLRNVPKTAAKCKLEGQSRTLSRRGGCGRKMRERSGKRAFLQGDCRRRCKRTDDHLLARRGTSTRKAAGGICRRLGSGRSPSRFGTIPILGVAEVDWPDPQSTKTKRSHTGKRSMAARRPSALIASRQTVILSGKESRFACEGAGLGVSF
jgi:hypothetical protein